MKDLIKYLVHTFIKKKKNKDPARQCDIIFKK